MARHLLVLHGTSQNQNTWWFPWRQTILVLGRFVCLIEKTYFMAPGTNWQQIKGEGGGRYDLFYHHLKENSTLWPKTTLNIQVILKFLSQNNTQKYFQSWFILKKDIHCRGSCLVQQLIWHWDVYHSHWSPKSTLHFSFLLMHAGRHQMTVQLPESLTPMWKTPFEPPVPGFCLAQP